MLFAPRNATIIEFPLKPHTDRCYGYMALALGHSYWLVPQITSHMFSNYVMDEVKVGLVVRLLRHVIDSKGNELHWSDEL